MLIGRILRIKKLFYLLDRECNNDPILGLAIPKLISFDSIVGKPLVDKVNTLIMRFNELIDVLNRKVLAISRVIGVRY